MKRMWLSVGPLILALLLLPGLLPLCVSAQSSEQSAGHPTAPNVEPLGNSPVPSLKSAHATNYKEIDLLRRDGFAGADQATVTVRVFNKAGASPGDLHPADFDLTVNGKRRAFRLHAPGAGAASVPAMVLLVFPPNQPAVHSMAAKQALGYFSHLTGERMPWKVATFDSNGKATTFTNSRPQLIAELNVIERTKAPSESTGEGLPTGMRGEGDWLTKAEQAIGAMQRYDGPKVVLAMGPLSTPSDAKTGQTLSQDGAEQLRAAAQHVGAHIYIDNVAGTESTVPGSEAAGEDAGTKPSSAKQIDTHETAALTNNAFLSSQMMQAAQATQGGFANSMDALAAQIHRNLDRNYLLGFDLTPQDRDLGVPAVGVKLARRDLRVTILDVIPVGIEPGSVEAGTARKLAALLEDATRQQLTSPDFQVYQHVDFFPMRAVEPTLPMGGAVEWIGKGRPPAELYVVESVEDASFSTMLMQREMVTKWDGRRFAWEHDGQLAPGQYVWRAGVYDGTGKILSASEEKVEVGFPHRAAVAVSSLVIGRICEEGRVASGLQHRPSFNEATHGTLPRTTNPVIDPMRAANCRVKLDSTDKFAPTDVLHAFVRIYPDDKLESNAPGSWTADFVLRSKSGSIESHKETAFTVDSGSGYLAVVEFPLNAPAVGEGEHTLDVQLRGPGIRGDVRKSRNISVEAP